MIKFSMERLLPSNAHYTYYTFDSFLRQQEELGYTKIDLLAAAPHVWITDRGCQDLEALADNISSRKLHVQILTCEHETGRYILNSAQPSRMASSMNYYENCMYAAKRLGAAAISVPLSGACWDEERQKAKVRGVESVKRLCEMAEKYGLCVSIDSPSKSISPLFSSLESMWELVRLAPHPLLRVTLDTSHISENVETIRQWFDALGERVSFVRLSDARAGDAQYVWGDGVLSLDNCLEELDTCGFAGWIGLRFSADGYFQEPQKASVRCYKALNRFILSEAK